MNYREYIITEKEINSIVDFITRQGAFLNSFGWPRLIGRIKKRLHFHNHQFVILPQGETILAYDFYIDGREIKKVNSLLIGMKTGKGLPIIVRKSLC